MQLSKGNNQLPDTWEKILSSGKSFAPAPSTLNSLRAIEPS